MKITIFGLAGTGTSTVGKLLGEQLAYEIKSTGNIMRSWAEEAGCTIYEFEDTVVKTDLSFDQKLDERVKTYGKENDNFIFESRLAWNFIPDSFKISLTCEDMIRYKRIYEREGGEFSEVMRETEKRESELIERYKRVYPEVLFPPSDSEFDCIIDTTHIVPQDIVAMIQKKIIER